MLIGINFQCEGFRLVGHQDTGVRLRYLLETPSSVVCVPMEPPRLRGEEVTVETQVSPGGASWKALRPLQWIKVVSNPINTIPRRLKTKSCSHLAKNPDKLHATLRRALGFITLPVTVHSWMMCLKHLLVQPTGSVTFSILLAQGCFP